MTRGPDHGIETATPARASYRRTFGLVTAAVAVWLVGIGVLAPAARAGDPRPVKGMSRNLYLGADLDPAIRATSVPELIAATSQLAAAPWCWYRARAHLTNTKMSQM